MASSVRYLKASNAGAGDRVGGGSTSLAVSADGNTLAVGAYREQSAATGIDGDQSDNSANAAGAVYVFVRSNGVWRQQAYVKASNAESGDEFGGSVALSADGDVLAVGAAGEDSAATGVGGDQLDNSVSNAGAAYVFSRVGQTWSQQAYLKASHPGANDFFGYSLTISRDGSTLAVGAPRDDSAATGIDGDAADNTRSDSGAVYVYSRAGQAWSQQAFVKASNPRAGDFFGAVVALSENGSTLAVGAEREDSASQTVNGDESNDLASNSGAAYVFVRNGVSWSQQAYLKAANAGAADRFGVALSLSADGSTLAVGAWNERGGENGPNASGSDNSVAAAGAAYVFVRSGVVWSQQAYLKAPIIAAGDWFGERVALSADGTVLAIAAYGEDRAGVGFGGQGSEAGAIVNSGAVHVFARTGAAWNVRAYLKATNTGADDVFGTTLAISADGSTIAIGAYGESSAETGVGATGIDNAAVSSGAVYVY